MWMRSSIVVRASNYQCRSRNSPRFDPSVLRHSEIWEATDKAVLKTEHKKIQKYPPVNYKKCEVIKFPGTVALLGDKGTLTCINPQDCPRWLASWTDPMQISFKILTLGKWYRTISPTIKSDRPDPLPLSQVMDLPVAKALCTGPYQSEVHR